MPKDSTISLRVPNDLLERADGLIQGLEANTEIAVWGGRVTRSNVLRLALLRGLDQLESETKKRRKSGA